MWKIKRKSNDIKKFKQIISNFGNVRRWMTTSGLKVLCSLRWRKCESMNGKICESFTGGDRQLRGTLIVDSKNKFCIIVLYAI